jgi:transposase
VEKNKSNKRKKKKESAPVFKPYTQHQTMMLPPSIEELIPQDHMVRVVNKTIEGLNIEPLIATYKAKALCEDVNYMWISGMQRPDFRTINIFRSGRLKGVVDQAFGSMVEFCIANKYIKLENYFVDGTKMEANARKTS